MINWTICYLWFCYSQISHVSFFVDAFNVLQLRKHAELSKHKKLLYSMSEKCQSSQFLDLADLDPARVVEYRDERIVGMLALDRPGYFHLHRGFNRFLRKPTRIPREWDDADTRIKKDWEELNEEEPQRSEFKDFEALEKLQWSTFVQDHVCDPTANIFQVPDPHPLNAFQDGNYKIFSTLDEGSIAFVVVIGESKLHIFGRTNDVIISQKEEYELQDKEWAEKESASESDSQSDTNNDEQLEDSESESEDQESESDDSPIEEEEDSTFASVFADPALAFSHTREMFVDLLKTYQPLDVFIGESKKNSGTTKSGWFGPDLDGNSILIRIESTSLNFRYVFIGSEVFEFSTTQQISKFTSSVSSGSSLPFAESQDFCYDMTLQTFAPTKDHPKRAKQGNVYASMSNTCEDLLDVSLVFVSEKERFAL